MLATVARDGQPLHQDARRAISRRTTPAWCSAPRARRPTSPSRRWPSCRREALDIVLADPAVAGVGSSVGASGFNASVNQGRMFISLKPLAERGGLTTAARHRPPAPRALARVERHQRVHDAGAGHPRRRAPERLATTSSRSGAPRSTSSTPGCRRWSSASSRCPGPRRRHHRPRAGRPAGQHHHRPAGGGAPRRARAGHQQRAQQRLLRSARSRPSTPSATSIA